MTSTGAIHPRPQQVDALTDLARALAVHDRAQVTMACGTGKTLVGRWHAQAAAAERTLVLLPSLSLLAQTLGEWRRAGGWPFEALVVCSDPSTTAGAAERRTDDGEADDVARPYWSQVRANVTTDPRVASTFLTRKVADRPQVVFSTYHSAPVVAAAQADSGTAFDLAICDEAHRLAGRPRDEFRVVLDRRAIVARKRLFMTATPHVAEGDDALSMDDPATFGPVAHTVSFGDAIAAGLLSDYQVLVVAGRGDQAASHGGTTVPSALLDAVDRHGIRRMLTFHSRVARAAAFADTVDGVHTPRRGWVRARHVSGKDSAADRAATLSWIGAVQDDQVRVVSSARCLTEGIDVPGVDAVMFADQRESVVDIIQAIGRVLRPYPGKERGTVIIPVELPADGDDDTALSLSAFSHVWAVLRGLRAHDQRLAEELGRAVRAGIHHRPYLRRATDRIQFLLPDDLDEPTVQLRLVQEVGSAWEKFYAATKDWASGREGARLGRNVSHHGVGVGEWAVKQRVARNRNVLPAERAGRLEQIPGWYWDRGHADWTDTYELLLSYAAAHDTVADRPVGDSRFAKSLSRGGVKLRLGVWLALQRQLHREGLLSADRAQLLEQLPGWDWSGGLRQIDVDMVQAMRVFYDFEKHADVPEDHQEDGLPLGRWVWAVRRVKLLGQLPPALADEVSAATGRDRKGADVFRWETAETQWRLSYSALRQYAARQGAPTPAGKRIEILDGTQIHLGQWAARQRFLHRRGELDQQYVDWLQALDGWRWEVLLTTVEYGEPLDLDGHPHGTAKGIQAKCPCRHCLDARRERDRVHIAKKRVLRNPVSAGRARHHITRLEAGGVKRTAIVNASRVPLGTIRKVASGEWSQLEREHEELLLQVTEQMCASVSNVVGSRGRLISASNEKVPAASTFALLDDLAGRGFGIAWVSRELGYVGGLQPNRQRDTVSRRIADQVAELHARTGDLRSPVTGRNRKAPPLSDLLRNRQVAA